jgi:hypothetical protein
MDRTELDRIERMIDREVKARFRPGTVQRATLQQGDGDDELLVRVFVTGETADAQQALDEWAQAHRVGMRRLRRELSLRLPEARLLEFTVDGDSRIGMPDDPELTHAPLPPSEVVAIALSQLRASYVFPDRAEAAATAIEARLAAGEYDDLDDDTLAERLTDQLHEVCADKHLRVRTVPPHMLSPRPPEPRRPPEPDQPAWQERIRPGNYGIHRVERLDGNVGYLDLRAVAPPEVAGPAIAAAMELVSGTYALIIDLRRNHGGSPHGVVFWCSYLFDGPDTHLSDIFDAVTGETRQFWSLAHVPGHRYLGRPVYVLTSSDTFSGGEDLGYTLQAQSRAELIGETTGGGAHPTRTMPISDTLAISVPHARSVNPVTGTNWQGTGVVPDVATPAAQACDVAYAKALRHVLALTVPPPIADEARAALAALPD